MNDTSKDDDASASGDTEELARNLAKAAGHGATLLASLAQPEAMRNLESSLGDSLADGVRTFGRLAGAWFNDPAKLFQAQTSLWTEQAELWQRTVRRALGEPVEPVATPQTGDRRFADEEWQANPAFDFLKQSYLISAAWAERLVEDTQDVDDHTRQKAHFYMRQLANALSPTNFALTNPEVLRETIKTNGRNLVQGMENLNRDVERGHGTVRVSQTDLDAFKVGENVATTPGSVVFQNDLFQLIQYEATTEKVFSTPLLIVPPWINKFYILDLTAEKSFVKWALEQGHTVFVVSWVNPDERLAAKSFEDYMGEGILAALGAVLSATGAERANIAGYCVGGTLLAATLAWLAAQKNDRIASATFLTAQIDFAEAGDLKVFVDEEQLDSIERKMEREGYLAGSSMAQVFNLLRSNDLIWSYVVNNYLLGRDPFPFDLLYWNSDSTRIPASNHAYYLRECYLNNALSKGKMTLGGERLDVTGVKVPVYSLATREDHIAPARSVFAGTRLLSGPVRFVVAGSGHIAGVINPPARGKYQFWADGKGETYDEWLASAHETAGSWWPDWQKWIEPHAGEQIAARKIRKRGKFKAIEDAPGSYVKVRAD